jgi:sensor histidine kinase YesM
MEALSFNVFEGYLITDANNQWFFYSGYVGEAGFIAASPMAFVYSLREPAGHIQDAGGHYFISQVISNGWIIVGYISNSGFNSTIIHQLYYILILFCIMAALSIVLIVPVLLRSMRPIRELSTVMDAVSAGDLSVRSAIATDDEIGRLSDIFNHMVENLQKNIDDRLAFEATEQRMKYNLHIAQFDSHFIYNTISTISALARGGRTDDIVVLNAALTQIMQNFLRVKTYDVTDTLEQEIKMVRQYWVIVNMRYDNYVNLIIDLPDELAMETIPKNIIQPLVENSLFHGLVNEENGEMHGEIVVKVRKKKDAIIITVADNGKGIDTTKLAILNELIQNDLAQGENVSLGKRGRHIGLYNISQRLAYIYKQSDCLRIESTPMGSVVSLHLPNSNLTTQ